MGAGVVAAAGLIALLRTLPSIAGALTQGLKKTGAGKSASAQPSRIEHDLPPIVVFGGSLLLVLLMFLFLKFKPIPGAQVGALANVAPPLLVAVFAFLLVTPSHRILRPTATSPSPPSAMHVPP